MKAMILDHITNVSSDPQPLKLVDKEIPFPGETQIRLRVGACAVCHTELDEIEGRTPPPRLPVIPGHQVVGQVERVGHGVRRWKEGDRVGVAWIYSACGVCEFCRRGDENLCPRFQATGRDANGGYAEYMVIQEDFVYPIPAKYSDAEAAPLLCAGAVGYRSLRLTGLQDGQILGLTGFGASGHLVLQMAKFRFPNSPVFVFARSTAEQEFARQLGAVWAGDGDAQPPDHLHAIIDTTPVWKPILSALKVLRPGGRLVINAIRKEITDQSLMAQIDYPSQLWMEKEIKSVANVSRRDVSEFLQLAADIGIRPEVQVYPLEEANRALMEMKARQIRGAKVLQMQLG